jgi:hypothetical protein
MSVFKRIKKSDVITVPYTANKQWDFSHLNASASGIFVYSGAKLTGSFNPSTDPMTTNSQFQRLVYEGINHQFYNAYSSSLLDTGSLMSSLNYQSASIYGATSSYNSPLNISYTTASFPEASGSLIKVLTIPTSLYGNAINKGTFRLSSSAYQIQDDGYGNLKDGQVCVGNIFYEHGVAVITDQSYQAYFTDTNTAALRWSNNNTPGGYTVDSNLAIYVNGVEKVNTETNDSGQFTVNVGDSIFAAAWSDHAWPVTGTSSLSLQANGTTLNTAVNGTYITQSYTVASTTDVVINAHGNYARDIAPARVHWYLSEYAEYGVAFIDANLRIETVGGGTVFLDQQFIGSGSLNISAGTTIEVYQYSFETIAIWGPYNSASLSSSIEHFGAVASSVTTSTYKSQSFADGTSAPVTLAEGEDYYVYTKSFNPTT